MNTHEIPNQVVVELRDWLKAMSPYKRQYMRAAMKLDGQMDLSLESVDPPTTRTKPVCSACGSDDIKADAFAVWNVEAQNWEVHDAYEKNGFCEACGGECSLDWEEVE